MPSPLNLKALCAIINAIVALFSTLISLTSKYCANFHYKSLQGSELFVSILLSQYLENILVNSLTGVMKVM